jgi:hypothetical protein
MINQGYLNEYHHMVTIEKMKSVAYWQQHPISHEKCLNQFKRLREQRLARESNPQSKL